MNCPAMSDSKAWDKYRKWEWEQVAKDKNNPEWLKQLAKDFAGV